MKMSHVVVWFWTAACFTLLPHCKTTNPSAAPTVAVSCTTLKALGDTFLVTGGGLDAAFDAKILSPKDYLPWHDFSLRFLAAYAIADKACEAALKSDDSTVQGVIATEMGLLQSQMGQFIALAAQVVKPHSQDGGTP